MASEEHKRLADFIKAVHNDLREKTHLYGATEAWRRHVEQRDVLQKYATSMEALATKHWVKPGEDPRKQQTSVKWIENECMEYFINGGLEKYNEREIEIIQKMLDTRFSDVAYPKDGSGISFEKCNEICDFNIGRNFKKVRLLDVGSCYNPLGLIEIFDVTAVDLTPFADSVLRCDFLSLKIGEHRVISEERKELKELPAKFFDAVAFCLLLEYMPCPEQRFNCCRKAYELLHSGGILIIVTPDSKHVGANARIMKSWRYVLSKLGFMRLKYEKLKHTHCLVFRKTVSKDVAMRWADLQNFPKDDTLFQFDNKIFIPQDFQERNNNAFLDKEIEYGGDVDMFDELPFAENSDR
ncbi:probable methyltransferase BMT2 homolog [Orussus abietinus]|uniref:probable methyltransferase BMT2 homolog n=1 Tax=Orussus abietinus TaxID=222816 RepID=UPI000626276B|nr:probable methyltransferase BMT2 homolog [Orussus abietinus]XP_012287350.1 probable methyltransferase BMT2 homolog [Orussus abietinus]